MSLKESTDGKSRSSENQTPENFISDGGIVAEGREQHSIEGRDELRDCTRRSISGWWAAGLVGSPWCTSFSPFIWYFVSEPKLRQSMCNCYSTYVIITTSWNTPLTSEQIWICQLLGSMSTLQDYDCTLLIIFPDFSRTLSGYAAEWVFSLYNVRAMVSAPSMSLSSLI